MKYSAENTNSSVLRTITFTPLQILNFYPNSKETRGDISTIDMRRDGIQKGNRHEKEKSNKEEVFTRFSHTVNIEYH